MKQIISLILLSLCSCFTFAQGSSSASASGSIYMPTLQSLKVERLYNDHILFDNAQDLTDGKSFTGFYKISVVSNIPWLVDVMTTGNTLSTTNEPGGSSNQSMPSNIISLKGNTGFIPLSAASQTLLISNNNLLQNHYLIDARFNPGWNYAGGQYSTTLLFTLTPQ